MDAAPVTPASPPALGAPGSEPDWIRGHPLVRQALEFLSTAAVFTLRPAPFTREWLAGTREATNPLTMVALSLAAVTSLRTVLGVSPAATGEVLGWWRTLALTALPYLHYVLVGGLLHAFILGFRAERPRLRTTVALMLFTAGGPVTVARLIRDAMAAAMRAAGVPLDADNSYDLADLGQHPVMDGLGVLAAAGALLLIVRPLVVSVATAHQLRAWKVLLAVTGALVVAGLIYGILGLPSVPGVFQPFAFQVKLPG